MQLLAIEPSLTLIIPHQPMTVVLVGCGGTGSHVAYGLARIAASIGRDLQIVFVDGDHVEPKNVGRQLFSMTDVGRNKAEVVAARLNAVFGLRIASIGAFCTPSLFQMLQGDTYMVVVGAVDTVDARLAIHTGLLRSRTLWIDSGNTEWGGQVYAGNGVPVRSSILGEVVTTVPWPSLQDRNLITHPPLSDADALPHQLACAEAMETNAQGLMVNQMMGAIASQYLYQIIVERQLTMMHTTMDLRLPTMRSQPITQSALEPFFSSK